MVVCIQRYLRDYQVALLIGTCLHSLDETDIPSKFVVVATPDETMQTQSKAE